ncbi:MAG: ERAP1-like C-terminal domain-containing protein, partial [Candidatus Saccharimonadales bacterium]
ADLWETFSTASGQDVGSFMDDWIRRPGYPLVSIDWQPGDKTLQLEQRRFLNDPSLENSETEAWQVPLAATQALSEPLLAKQKATVPIESSVENPLLFNHDGQSYFLPYYTEPAHLQQIVDGIKNDKVGVIDRLLLLDNYTMLQRGGVSSTTDLLEVLQGYDHETSESVWGCMAVAIGEVRKLIEGDETSEGQLHALVGKLVQPVVNRLGWEDTSDDSAQDLRLRGLAHSIAAGAQIQSVLDEGLRRFKTMEQPSDLPASTRTVIYHIAARHGTEADFEKLLKLHHTLINADEKEEVAAGLASAKDPKRYKQLLPMLTNGEVRRQDLLHWFAWLLRNRYSREAAWQWLVETWDWIEKELSSDKTYSYFARYAGSVFSRPDELKKFQEFFEPKKSVVGLDHEITLGEADIRSRIAWRQRNEATAKAWLQKHKA